MKNLNKMKIAPDMQYEIGQDKVGYFPEWSVKDDETLLNKVKQIYGTAFDKSKFTKHGSPTVTNDGVASDFNASNWLQLSNEAYSTDNFIFNVKVTIKSPPVSGYGMICGYFPTQHTYFSYNPSDGGLSFKLMNSTPTLLVRVATPVTIGNTYDVKVTYSNKVLSIYTNGVLQDSATYDGEDLGYIHSNLLIGSWGNASIYNFGFPGIIDLKSLRLEIDGEEIFSGCKTGLDIIKADNWTPLPNSTTVNNKLTTNRIFTPEASAVIKSSSINFSTAKSWKICYRQLTMSSVNHQQVFLGLASMQGFQAVNFQNSRITSFQASEILFGASAANQVSYTDNTWQDFEIGQETQSNGSIKTFVRHKKTSDQNFTEVSNLNATKIMDYNGEIILGGYYDNGQAQINKVTYNGSFDTNYFKIYVDNELVYQACLRIPYVEGQKYTKIVDEKNRPLVKDLFDQTEYNIYYTLGEDDFTLPSNKPNDIVKYKADGLTVAEQRADQTLTIRGACESGVDVNLPMNFFDGSSYAVFGVGTTGTNTASKFTPAADGNYIAIGKGKV